MRVDGVIFDLDGVMVDTARYHYLSWKKVANSLGGDLSIEQNEKIKGVSRAGSLEFILANNGVLKTEEEKIELAEQKNQWFLELIGSLENTELLPGVLTIIKQLDQLGIPIGLGSASRNAIAILQKIGIDHYFKTMVDGNSVEKSKPNPEVFNKGVNGLGIDPENCIIFEDSSKGIKAAITGGFIPIGIGDRKNLPEALLVYKGFEEITFESICHDIQDKLSEDQ